VLADDASMRTSALRALAPAAALSAVVGLATAVPATAADTPSPAPAVETHPVPPDGVFRMTGSGWGHGRGMSQWGAYQAATENVAFPEILAFYYPGTTLGVLPAADVRVLLSADTGRDLVVRAAPGMTVQGQGAAPVALGDAPTGCAAPATRWRARAAGAGLRLQAWCGRWVTSGVLGPRLTFATPEGVVATQSGVVRRGYRGTITAIRTGPRSVQVVNTVPMEQYLRAVVPTEVSPSWPDQALRAQAVAARSYAARESLGRAARSFDVYDTTRSQAYPGAFAYDARWRTVRSREHARTDAAILETAGLHVLHAGAPALTMFAASNGGATAGAPLPYLTAQADPWDARATRNPRLAWTDTIAAATLGARYRLGQVGAIEVLGREVAGPSGGRITSLRIVGTAGSRVLTGDSAIRAGLGTYSSMLTFVPPPPPPA
jgi:SpoIID/LytB domain protein